MTDDDVKVMIDVLEGVRGQSFEQRRKAVSMVFGCSCILLALSGTDEDKARVQAAIEKVSHLLPAFH